MLKIFHNSLYNCTLGERCPRPQRRVFSHRAQTRKDGQAKLKLRQWNPPHNPLNLHPSMRLLRTKAHTPAERYITPSNRNAQVPSDQFRPSPFSSQCFSQLLSPYSLAWAPPSLPHPQSLAGSTLRLTEENAVTPLLKSSSPGPNPTSPRTGLWSMHIPAFLSPCAVR